MSQVTHKNSYVYFHFTTVIIIIIIIIIINEYD